jgi:hypothetical protein
MTMDHLKIKIDFNCQYRSVNTRVFMTSLLVDRMVQPTYHLLGLKAYVLLRHLLGNYIAIFRERVPHSIEICGSWCLVAHAMKM